MKNRFTIQIRGNVDYESEAALQKAMSEFLAQYPAFKVNFKSIEVWSDMDGKPRVFAEDEGPALQRFTLQIRGNIDYESEDALAELISQIVQAFPIFHLMFKSIEKWVDYEGKERLFNEDGSEYHEPVVVNPVTEEPESTVEITQVV